MRNDRELIREVEMTRKWRRLCCNVDIEDDEDVRFRIEGRAELELEMEVEAYWRRRTGNRCRRKPCFGYLGR